METIRVVVQEFGAVLGKHSERLVVKTPSAPRVEAADHPAQLRLRFGDQKELPFRGTPEAGRKKDREKHEYPLFRVSEIVVTGRGVSVSTDLIEECCLRGIPITFLTPGGKPYAALHSPELNATVATRREQFRAYDDLRGLELSRKIVSAKLRNQSNCLRYFGKYLKSAHPDLFAPVEEAAGEIAQLAEETLQAQGRNIDEARPRLLALEGRGGDLYWRAVARILQDKAEFAGREHRGTENPVNACLNYGYGILTSRVWASVACAGLEPFAGYLHVDRPGKPSLVLDLMEEFRQPVVDRAVIAMFHQGRPVRMEGGLLDDESRKLVAAEVGERLDTAEPYGGERLRLASIVQGQARRVASFLRGERSYEPFTMRW